MTDHTPITDFISTTALLLISLFLIRKLLILRQRRRLILNGNLGNEYTGSAINPNSLIDPNKDAVEQMTKLLEQAGFHQEE